MILRRAATSTPPTARRSTSARARSGDNPLGTNDGDGYDVNPATGEPYEPERRAAGRLRPGAGRVLGRRPRVGDAAGPLEHHRQRGRPTRPDLELRIGGEGAEVDRLEWDVKLYFALNGAVHDAAVAAWGAKGHYDSARPISMIRYMGGHGQSTDPAGPSYHPDGLPLVPGLVEVVTAGVERARAAPRAPRRPRRARSPSRRGRATPRTRDAGQRRGVDPRRRLGALPARRRS